MGDRPTGPDSWQPSSCTRAARTGLAGQAGVSAAEAASESETAVALLHKAVAMGYRGPAADRIKDTIDPLRGRDDFRLLMDLAMPVEPFAAAR